jgi:methylmalonyl-CoA mutase, N-terminal domain
VNKYTAKEEAKITTLKIDFKAQRRQIERIRRVRAQRDDLKVKALLEKLRKAYEDPEANSMYPLLDAVSAYATLGELVGIGKDVFGGWKEPVLV